MHLESSSDQIISSLEFQVNESRFNTFCRLNLLRHLLTLKYLHPATGPSMSFSFLPSSPCQPGEIHFSLALVTDEKGNEVSWALLETYTGSIALSGNGYTNNEQTNVGTCLPTICYTFVINDTGNDGLCCAFGDGGFVVRINGVKVAIGNEFGSTDKHDLPCIRPPTSSPTTATPTASVMVGRYEPWCLFIHPHFH